MGLVRIVHPREEKGTLSHHLTDCRGETQAQISRRIGSKIWYMRSRSSQTWLLVSPNVTESFCRIKGFARDFSLLDIHPEDVVENLITILLEPKTVISAIGKYYIPRVRLVSYEDGDKCAKCGERGANLIIRRIHNYKQATLLCHSCFRVSKLSDKMQCKGR